MYSCTVSIEYFHCENGGSYLLPVALPQMSHQLGKKLLLVLVAVLFSTSRVQAQGLFPSLYSPTNFATRNPVTATSVCAGCSDGEHNVDCESCNNTCPFGDTLPEPLDLMATGMPQAGVVSPKKELTNCTISAGFLFCRRL